MGDMHIGLIGGIGPAATVVYYERIVKVFAAAARPLHLTIGHTSVQQLAENSAGGFAAKQAFEYKRITDQLVAGGASLVAVTSMGGHFCAKEFSEVTPLPVVDGPESVAAHFKRRAKERIGILGTGSVMASRLYGALQDLDTVVPSGRSFDQVNDDYIAIATTGVATEPQRERLLNAGLKLIHSQGAKVILLAGTDLSLVYGGAPLNFPVVDSAIVHADAIAERAMAERAIRGLA